MLEQHNCQESTAAKFPPAGLQLLLQGKPGPFPAELHLPGPSLQEKPPPHSHSTPLGSSKQEQFGFHSSSIPTDCSITSLCRWFVWRPGKGRTCPKEPKAHAEGSGDGRGHGEDLGHEVTSLLSCLLPLGLVPVCSFPRNSLSLAAACRHPLRQGGLSRPEPVGSRDQDEGEKEEEEDATAVWLQGHIFPS